MINARVDRAALKEMRERLAKNIKFGYVAAMTWAVRETAEDLKTGLQASFTLRNQYVKGGIRSTPAKVQDDVPVAIVGAIAPSRSKGLPFMQKHVEGNDDPERDITHSYHTVNGQRVDLGAAVPIGARPQKSVWTKKRVWPGKILERDGAGTVRKWRGDQLVQEARKTNRTFITKIRGRYYVVTRKTKGKRAALKFWYMFVDKVKIKPDWPFKDYLRSVTYHFGRAFRQKMKENL